MTRFARAKGSKASNERKEEEPTPWHVMRQQLADHLNTDSSQNNTGNTVNLKSLVKNNTNLKEEEIWSEFGEVSQSSQTSSSKISKGKKKDKRTKNSTEKHKAIKENKDCKPGKGDNLRSIDKSHHLSVKQIRLETTHKGTKKIKLIKLETKSEKQQCENHTTGSINSDPEIVVDSQTQKAKQLKIAIEDEMSTNQLKTEQTTTDSLLLSRSDKTKKNKIKQSSQWKNHTKVDVIIANGRAIKVVNFEGFCIKQDDAVELKKLRKRLRAENIPKEKIKAVMKLERRKAEKALAREKNTVCFHCRKFGHNFADCPDIKNTILSKSGICFKCGSTEHTHFECKVLQRHEFPFATCFVCKEQGHIARQCKLNPQGQYPKGGSCHLCGEVTHLRKDCPKACDEKSTNTLTVEQLVSDKIEDVSDVTPRAVKKLGTPKKKLVVF